MLSNFPKYNSFQSAVSGTTRILDAAVAAGVKQVIITASVLSLVFRGDFWKDITINEKCESSKKNKVERIGMTYAACLLQHTTHRRPKRR